ncbi:MAG: hypothetical protein ACHQ53_09355 [Polyangiales bacterium]
MRYRRLKLILLSLGVVLGYGSAYGQLRHTHRGLHAHECAPWSWDGWGGRKDTAK